MAALVSYQNNENRLVGLVGWLSETADELVTSQCNITLFDLSDSQRMCGRCSRASPLETICPVELCVIVAGVSHNLLLSAYVTCSGLHMHPDV